MWQEEHRVEDAARSGSGRRSTGRRMRQGAVWAAGGMIPQKVADETGEIAHKTAKTGGKGFRSGGIPKFCLEITC
jgi:hypothetical protein